MKDKHGNSIDHPRLNPDLREFKRHITRKALKVEVKNEKV